MICTGMTPKSLPPAQTWILVSRSQCPGAYWASLLDDSLTLDNQHSPGNPSSPSMSLSSLLSIENKSLQNQFPPCPLMATSLVRAFIFYFLLLQGTLPPGSLPSTLHPIWFLEEPFQNAHGTLLPIYIPSKQGIHDIFKGLFLTKPIWLLYPA